MGTIKIKFKDSIPNRVLVADDDPVIRHLVATVIKQQGCEVVIASDGREAYKVLQSDSRFKAAILR